MVALIPARANSQRIPGKNTRLLAGHPLIAYTIAAAQQSGVFSDIILATDDPKLMALDGVTKHWRAPVSDHQADIVWVREVLSLIRPDTFAILRPTSPFRTADTIRRAFKQFIGPDQTADSLRAVEPVKQHPMKMWELTTGYITPLFPYTRSDGVPGHSCPTQSLPTFYVQNSSLEMGYTHNIEGYGTIHGHKVAPFFTQGYEGFSVDWAGDFDRAEELVAKGLAELPHVPTRLE